MSLTLLVTRKVYIKTTMRYLLGTYIPFRMAMVKRMDHKKSWLGLEKLLVGCKVVQLFQKPVWQLFKKLNRVTI